MEVISTVVLFVREARFVANVIVNCIVHRLDVIAQVITNSIEDDTDYRRESANFCF